MPTMYFGGNQEQNPDLVCGLVQWNSTVEKRMNASVPPNVQIKVESASLTGMKMLFWIAFHWH